MAAISEERASTGTQVNQSFVEAKPILLRQIIDSCHGGALAYSLFAWMRGKATMNIVG
jgi:hypothetical protein